MINKIKDLKDITEELIKQKQFFDKLIEQNKKIISKIDDSEKEIDLNLKNETKILKNFIMDNLETKLKNVPTKSNQTQHYSNGLKNYPNNNTINKQLKSIDKTNENNNILPLIKNKRIKYKLRNTNQVNTLATINENSKNQNKTNYKSKDKQYNSNI